MISAVQGKPQLLSTKLQCQDLPYFLSMHTECECQGKKHCSLKDV